MNFDLGIRKLCIFYKFCFNIVLGHQLSNADFTKWLQDQILVSALLMKRITFSALGFNSIRNQ